ncbi:MAG: hypothetical protein L6264_07240 [Weeksellaceae bacterium]|nr:hypothetical protein [Bacteroidota bacterium]MCG2780727.1 hypothetical protein [Weeksellaceae bacterium]
MAKLITKKETLYRTRSPRYAKIMLEMKVGDQQGDSFPILVTDYIVTETQNEDETVSHSFTHLESDTKMIPVAMINQLYEAVASQIPAGTPFSEKQVLERELAFLYYVSQVDRNPNNENRCIYSLEPEDFEIFRG